MGDRAANDPAVDRLTAEKLARCPRFWPWTGRASRSLTFGKKLARKNCFVPLIGDFHYIGHKLLADHNAPSATARALQLITKFRRARKIRRSTPALPIGSPLQSSPQQRTRSRSSGSPTF
jgi:hypothetical protein